jgi:hypothetical protein
VLGKILDDALVKELVERGWQRRETEAKMS